MARTRQTARISTGGKAPRKGKKKSSSNSAEELTETQVNYDVTYETSFYAHYFETGQEDTKVFQPKYSVLKLTPESASQPEYWMGVNFNSKFDGEGLSKYGRPDLCLVIALDISGSMGSTFQGDDSNSSKLKVAKEAVKAIISQLKDNDVLGIILFDDKPSVFMPLTKCSDIDQIKLEKEINQWNTAGGTAITKAYESSFQMLLKALEGSNNSKRIFLLTDMEVCGKQDGDNLVAAVNQGSSESVWTTVVGIGEDLTSSIIERISKVPGSNYSNVRSADGFRELMDKEFGFLVTPLGFNIEMDLTSKDVFVIEKGYGSPEVRDLSEGQVVRFSTEFPSLKNERGEKRGAVILFKLRSVSTDGSPGKFTVRVQHENLKGVIETDEKELEFTNEEDLSLRKAVLLVKYTDFVRGYLSFRENRVNGATSPADNNYHERIQNFIKVFQTEMALVGDASLTSELDILSQLLSLEPSPSSLEDSSSASTKEEQKSKKLKVDKSESEEDKSNTPPPPPPKQTNKRRILPPLR